MMRSEDSARFLGIALAAAREAAAHVHRAWRKRPVAEHKGPVDLVTKYDRESEHLLRARLSAATPFPVVGEEHGGAPSNEETWYVDPIDGTTNFVHGHPFYCVSVGLVRGGVPVLGAVVAPALGVEWTGIVGSAETAGLAKRANEVCVVSTVSKLDDALLATGFPYERGHGTDNNFDAFVHIKRRCQAVRRCGSAALDLCLVADGTYDGYWERKLGPWDCAGGAAIVLAAGGAVSDYAGDPLDVRAGSLVATNGVLHATLVSALAAAPKTLG